ncbi:hypothetical protein SOVF_044180 [Spinacia oleracea]|nr:hypothetical protein SOVF_044180 [Spinacia oleracea]
MASSAVASALEWIGLLLIQEASTLLGVEDQILNLQADLELMQQYLQDADGKQEAREVRTLICQIRKLAYDAEDVIDTYILKIQPKAQRSNESRLMRYVCFMFNSLHIYN